MHLRNMLVAVLLLACSVQAMAGKRDTANPVKVVVLIPLYLDSAFTGTVYKLGNRNLPKYILPGLDFYNGVAMAIDSLQKDGLRMEVLIHDTKSREKSLDRFLSDPAINNASFIIGSFTTRDELLKVAQFARQQNIPLISATYPNDGGVVDNPNLVIINSTLPTHIEGIFRYVHRNHSLDNIILFRRKSDAMDGFIMERIMDASRRFGATGRINYVEVSDVFNPQEVISRLDSTRKNVIIGATLNETFAGNLVRTLSGVKATYQSIAVGMPTWDNMKELRRADTRGVEIVYTTPYNYQKTDKLLNYLAASYREKLNGRASDMMFKGYEAMYHFTRLYFKHEHQFLQNLSDNAFVITNEFDFQPIRTRKDNTAVDYYENKKLYFVVKQDGVIKSVR